MITATACITLFRARAEANGLGQSKVHDEVRWSGAVVDRKRSTREPRNIERSQRGAVYISNVRWARARCSRNEVGAVVVLIVSIQVNGGVDIERAARADHHEWTQPKQVWQCDAAAEK